MSDTGFSAFVSSTTGDLGEDRKTAENVLAFFGGRTIAQKPYPSLLNSGGAIETATQSDVVICLVAGAAGVMSVKLVELKQTGSPLGIPEPNVNRTPSASSLQSALNSLRQKEVPYPAAPAPKSGNFDSLRQLGVLEVPLADLKASAHACEATLNDAFLAAVAGGVRRYHERHEAEIGDLHVTMPLSLRTESDAIGGNRITLMRFDVPARIPRADTRMRAIHVRAQRMRSERSLPYTQAIAGALNLLPRSYLAAMLRHVDVLVSDVPGIPVPVWLGGAKVLVQYPFGPTIGSAVNVTLMSYVDTCAIGVDVDTGAVPDPEVFLECLREGFDEVLAVGAVVSR